jgi:3',5'-cyclic AMP phosphodiesterase CpdA
MSATWLHVSDFHVGTGDSYERNLILGALVEAGGTYREVGHAPDLIFATGDLGDTGKAGDCLLAEAFFNDVLETAGLDRRRLFVIPGNHDVHRSLGEGLAPALGETQAIAYFWPGTRSRTPRGSGPPSPSGATTHRWPREPVLLTSCPATASASYGREAPATRQLQTNPLSARWRKGFHCNA